MKFSSYFYSQELVTIGKAVDEEKKGTFGLSDLETARVREVSHNDFCSN
jgi:hypothetical protein